MPDQSPPLRPTTPPRPRIAVTIAMVPLGAGLGWIGALLIEIVVGFLAGTYFNAERPAQFSWGFMGSLPGLGAMIGAVLAPILYVRSRRPQRGHDVPRPGHPRHPRDQHEEPFS